MARRVRPKPLTYREIEQRLLDVSRLAALALAVSRVPKPAREFLVEIVRITAGAVVGE